MKGDLLEGANAYHCEKCNKKVSSGGKKGFFLLSENHEAPVKPIFLQFTGGHSEALAH